MFLLSVLFYLSWVLWKFCNSFAVPSNSEFLHNGTSIGLSRQHENRFNAWVSPKSRQRKKGKTQGWLCLLNASHQSASLPRSAGDSPNGRYSTRSFLSVSDKHLRLLELISRLVVDGRENLNSWDIDERKGVREIRKEWILLRKHRNCRVCDSENNFRTSPTTIFKGNDNKNCSG